VDQEMCKRSDWLLVTDDIQHLEHSRLGELTWWCVDRKSKEGDRVFLYKTLTGIVCLFEIKQFIAQQDYCKIFRMDRAQVKVLKVFKPPISAKALREARYVRLEPFIKRNFHGKSFLIRSENTYEQILLLKK